MPKKLKKAIGLALINRYKQNKQKLFDSSLDHCLESVRTILKKAKYCFLITNSEREWPSARMVQPIVDDETLVIWLGTNPNLRKVREIEVNPLVTLAFGSEKENANVIIYGKASIVRDDQLRKKHWLGSWSLFFPGGPKGDNFVSIKVEPHAIELMDFKRNIVDEPFGLKPVKLTKGDGGWLVE